MTSQNARFRRKETLRRDGRHALAQVRSFNQVNNEHDTGLELAMPRFDADRIADLINKLNLRYLALIDNNS